MADGHAWEDLMWAEMADIGTLLREIPDADFSKPTLCDGWEVRDVLGHMLVGHTTGGGEMFKSLAKYRFNVTKASFDESKEFGHEHTPDELRDQWDAMVANRTSKGIAKLIPKRDGFVDHVIHHQDIRRGIDRPRTIPEDRIVPALEGVVKASSPMFNPKKNVKGLRLQATDIDWSHGEGAEVTGTGEAILMAAGGRRAALADLDGDGVDTLRDRITA